MQGSPQYPWDNASPETKAALAELQGYELQSKGDIGPAFQQFGKATSMRTESLARAHLTARNYGFAESIARKAVDQNPNQVPPLAALVEVLQAVGKETDAIDAHRRLELLAKGADRDVPVFRRLEPIVARWRAEKLYPPAGAATAEPSSGTEETAIDRIDLNTLGPLVWSPFPAPSFSSVDSTGKRWELSGLKGKNVLLIFFLGETCAHCLQQLQAFGKEFEA